MTRLIALKKEVEKIRQQVGPPEDIVIVWFFGNKDEPHGKYGCSTLHINTGKQDWPTEKQERSWLKDLYASKLKQDPRLKRLFPTFEDFLKAQKCTCPIQKGAEKTI